MTCHWYLIKFSHDIWAQISSCTGKHEIAKNGCFVDGTPHLGSIAALGCPRVGSGSSLMHPHVCMQNGFRSLVINGFMSE